MTREEAIAKVKGYLTDLLPSEEYDEVEEIIQALELEPIPATKECDNVCQFVAVNMIDIWAEIMDHDDAWQTELMRNEEFYKLVKKFADYIYTSINKVDSRK